MKLHLPPKRFFDLYTSIEGVKKTENMRPKPTTLATLIAAGGESRRTTRSSHTPSAPPWTSGRRHRSARLHGLDFQRTSLHVGSCMQATNIRWPRACGCWKQRGVPVAARREIALLIAAPGRASTGSVGSQRQRRPGQQNTQVFRCVAK